MSVKFNRKKLLSLFYEGFDANLKCLKSFYQGELFLKAHIKQKNVEAFMGLLKKVLLLSEKSLF